MASIKFIVKSKSDISTIYVRFKQNPYDITAKTNFIINYRDWSNAKGLPKTTKDANLKRLDNDLRKLSVDLMAHYNNSIGKDSINTEWLKSFINPKPKQKDVSSKLISYFDHYLLHKKNVLSKASFKKLNVVKQLVYRFQKATKREYLIKEVDNDFKLKFENYCLTENYAPNTIARTFNFVKTICYHARNNGIETHFQLDGITTKYHKVEKIYLSPVEIIKIEKAKLTSDNHIHARDWLVISCETGQRVSDFLKFNEKMIRFESKKPLIEFTQQKTKKLMTVPLSKKVMEILKKRKGEFPKTMTDQKYNDYIKEVCEIAGLKEKVKGSVIEVLPNGTKRKKSGVFEKWQLITSHVGRRSFATNNYGRIPTSLLIGATGHSTEKQFLDYIGKSDSQKALQLAEYF
jgi:integrase